MSFPRTHILLALALFVGAVGAGCQNSADKPMQTMAPTQKALVITSNSGATVVLLPNADNSDVEMLSTSGNATMCEQCRLDAIKYFRTGQITPKCSVCGAMRTPVNYVAPASTSGHN